MKHLIVVLSLFTFISCNWNCSESNSSKIGVKIYVDREYFRTIEQKYTTPDGSTHISIKTLVYQKGLEFIRKIVMDNNSQLMIN